MGKNATLSNFKPKVCSRCGRKIKGTGKTGMCKMCVKTLEWEYRSMYKGGRQNFPASVKSP